MGFIALSALLIAATIFSNRGEHTYFILILAALGCAGLGVLLYSLRLSGWMRVVIAGYIGPTLLGAVEGLAIVFLPSAPSSDAVSAINLIIQSGSSLLLVVGFAMTFQDIRRRLTNCENTAVRHG